MVRLTEGSIHRCIRIRAHHLLCLLGFRGWGYSKQFVDNMQRIAQKFYDPATLLEVVVGCDAICDFCPYNKAGECCRGEGSSQKVDQQDLEVMAKLGLKPETRLSSDEARARIKESFSVQDLSCICGDCEWLNLGYCTEGLNRLKSGESHPISPYPSYLSNHMGYTERIPIS